LTLHFDEPGGGAGELETLSCALARIEIIRRRLGTDEEARAAVVERVDEQDEALRFVAAALGEHRHMFDENGREARRDRQVVARAERPFAEVGETEAGGV